MLDLLNFNIFLNRMLDHCLSTAVALRRPHYVDFISLQSVAMCLVWTTLYFHFIFTSKHGRYIRNLSQILNHVHRCEVGLWERRIPLPLLVVKVYDRIGYTLKSF